MKIKWLIRISPRKCDLKHSTSNHLNITAYPQASCSYKTDLTELLSQLSILSVTQGLMPSPFLTKFSALPIISKASQTPLFDHVWPLGSGRNFGKLGFIMFYTLHRSRLCLVSTSQYGRGSKIPHINRKRRIKLFKTGFPFFLWLLYLLHKHGMAMAATCMGFPPINNSPRSQAIHCYQRTEQRSSELPTRHGATLTPLRKPLSHTMEKVSKAGCGATSQLALYPIPVQENMDFLMDV